MEEKNIVFLDIDGVVNTLQINDKPFENDKGVIYKDNFYFKINSASDGEVSNRQAILWLNKLCLETDAKIVISSTWRMYGNYDNAVTALYNSGLNKNIEIIGMTPTDGFSCPRLGYWQTRGTEIKNWLLQNENKVSNYVILDDDNDMEDLSSHLVQCNTYHGLGCLEYMKAKEVLIDFN